MVKLFLSSFYEVINSELLSITLFVYFRTILLNIYAFGVLI